MKSVLYLIGASTLICQGYKSFHGSRLTALSHISKVESLRSIVLSSTEIRMSTETFPNENSKNDSILDLTRLIGRFSWISWWMQIILSVISGVILTFANTVRVGGANKALWSSGFAFSTIGVVIAFLNTFWTWSTTRISRRVYSNKVERNKVVPLYRQYFRVSVAIAIIGMLVSLIAAEQIVGNLAAKVLAIQGFQPYSPPLNVMNNGGSSSLQPLDIFLVQANTNAILANFVPNLFFSFLLTQLPQQVPYPVNGTTHLPPSTGPAEKKAPNIL